MTGNELSAHLERCRTLPERPYDEGNTSPEELEIIRQSTFQLSPGIIYSYELPCITPYNIGILCQRQRELNPEKRRYVLLVDLTRAHRPDVASRRAIKAVFADPCLARTVLCTEKNLLINVSVQFILNTVAGNVKWDVVQARARAIEVARKAVAHGL